MSLRCAHHTRPAKLLALAILATCFSPLNTAAQAPRYTVSDLGPFTPRGVNEVGQAAGFAIIGGRGFAVLYDGTLKTINPNGASYAEANAVNNNGQVIGLASFCDIVDGNCVNSRTRAFIYQQGAFTIFGTLGGRDSVGHDINDAGLAVGSSSTPGTSTDISGSTQAFTSGGGPLENLGARMGVGGSTAGAVNSVGQIAGHFSDRNGVGGFLYDSNDGTFSLFQLRGIPSDINDLKQIVGGLSGNDDGSGRAFLYAGSALKDLGTLLPAHTFSSARAINNAGQIVGVSSQSFFTRQDERAFLYEDGRMLDLNGLIPPGSGWVLNVATDINNHGQIVGLGRLDGQERGFMLTPVGPPVLLTQPDSERALALDSVTFERDPFTLSTVHNFSADGRRRIMLFARNVEFAPNEKVQELVVRAEGAEGVMHFLPVEHVGRVPGFPSLTQITVRLPDGMAAGGDFRLCITLRGAASNMGTVSIRPRPTGSMLQ